MLPWAVLDPDGRVLGSTRYHDIVPAAGRVEIGYTWYATGVQGTGVNPAAKLLLLEHAFDTLGCGVVALRTDRLNARSRAAIQALGAQLDGVLRHHQPRPDGTVRDTALYSILDRGVAGRPPAAHHAARPRQTLTLLSRGRYTACSWPSGS